MGVHQDARAVTTERQSWVGEQARTYSWHQAPQHSAAPGVCCGWRKRTQAHPASSVGVPARAERFRDGSCSLEPSCGRKTSSARWAPERLILVPPY